MSYNLLMNLSGNLIKGARSMPGRGIALFGGTISFALYGHTVKNLGSFDILKIVENRDQVIDIMTIHRAKVSKVERFKEITLTQQSSFDARFNFRNNFLRALSKH